MRYLIPIMLVVLLMIPLSADACKHKVMKKTHYTGYHNCGCDCVSGWCETPYNPPAVVAPIYRTKPYCCKKTYRPCCSAQLVPVKKVCVPNVYYIHKWPKGHPVKSCGVDVRCAPCQRTHYRTYYRK